MEANLDLKITGVKGGNPSWNPNKGLVVAFIDNGKDYISVDAFQGLDKEYKRREVCEIEINLDGKSWKGTKEQLALIFFGKEPTATTKKEDTIKSIKDIIEQWGDFQMSEDCLDKESAITVKKIGNTVSSIYAFGYDGVDCDIYVNDTDTDSESYDYEDLDLDILEEILRIAEIYEVDSQKTFKRCQD